MQSGQQSQQHQQNLQGIISLHISMDGMQRVLDMTLGSPETASTGCLRSPAAMQLGNHTLEMKPMQLCSIMVLLPLSTVVRKQN